MSQLRDWFPAMDLTKWTDIGRPSRDEHHLWRRDPQGFDMWASVTDDYETWEFRDCVLCGAKQIREFSS